MALVYDDPAPSGSAKKGLVYDAPSGGGGAFDAQGNPSPTLIPDSGKVTAPKLGIAARAQEAFTDTTGPGPQPPRTIKEFIAGSGDMGSGDYVARSAMAIGNAAAGGAAGVAEGLGMTRTNANKLERDLRALGTTTGAILPGAPESGMRAVTAPVSDVATATADWARRRGERHPWTREMVGRTAWDLGAPPLVAKATKVVEKRMNQADVTTAQGAIDSLNFARSAGKPMILPDVMQGGVQRLAGRVSRTPGESSEIMSQPLRARNAGAVERLTGDVNKAFGEEGAYDAAQALMSARKAAAKPAYDAAYAHPPVNPDVMKSDGQIGSLMERPSVRAGMANARKIAAEEGVDMNTLGIDLNEQGEPILTKVPTWQTLDYMKRGIDNVVEQYRDGTTGKLNLDTYGRAADITRGEFVRTLRDLNPGYGKALDTWGGPSRSLDAIQVGADALKRSADVNTARVAEMSADEQEFARLGIAQTLRDIANKRGPLAPEFDRVAGTQYGSTSTRSQLRPFFQDDASYKQFIDSVTAETIMARTGNRILGGSQTAERVAEDQGPISPADAIHGGTSLALGHPVGIARAAANLGLKLWDRSNGPLNSEIARILGNTENTIARDPKGRLVIVRPERPPP